MCQCLMYVCLGIVRVAITNITADRIEFTSYTPCYWYEPFSRTTGVLCTLFDNLLYTRETMALWIRNRQSLRHCNYLLLPTLHSTKWWRENDFRITGPGWGPTVTVMRGAPRISSFDLDKHSCWRWFEVPCHPGDVTVPWRNIHHRFIAHASNRKHNPLVNSQNIYSNLYSNITLHRPQVNFIYTCN